MFSKHFATKNQLPGLSIIGKLVENGLSNMQLNFSDLWLVFLPPYYQNFNFCRVNLNLNNNANNYKVT